MVKENCEKWCKSSNGDGIYHFIELVSIFNVLKETYRWWLVGVGKIPDPIWPDPIRPEKDWVRVGSGCYSNPIGSSQTKKNHSYITLYTLQHICTLHTRRRRTSQLTTIHTQSHKHTEPICCECCRNQRPEVWLCWNQICCRNRHQTGDLLPRSVPQSAAICCRDLCCHLLPRSVPWAVAICCCELLPSAAVSCCHLLPWLKPPIRPDPSFLLCVVALWPELIF